MPDLDLDITAIYQQAQQFGVLLGATKAALAPKEFGWYPYGTLNNFTVFDMMLHGENRKLFRLLGDGPFVDIGAADGDTAFFLESCGYKGEVIDYAPTNFNSCRGVRALKTALNSSITINEFDLDAQPWHSPIRYRLAFFLGILYHLKNPFLALESLARNAEYALVSTRITRFNVAQGATGAPGTFNSERHEIRPMPVAYLVSPTETNNDATNYWMFSEAGLRRIFDRTGWDIVEWTAVGNTTDSDPATGAGDERAFALLRSRVG